MGGEFPGRGDKLRPKDECATEIVTARAFQAEAAVSSGGGKVGVSLRRKMDTEVHSR